MVCLTNHVGLKTGKQVLKLSVLISLLLTLISCCHREEIDIPINADFSYEVLNNDYSIPVKIAFVNKSTGAQTYTWAFESGSPEARKQKDPGYIIFPQPGTIKGKMGSRQRWRVPERRDRYSIRVSSKKRLLFRNSFEKTVIDENEQIFS
jgi:hypothetical protein